MDVIEELAVANKEFLDRFNVHAGLEPSVRKFGEESHELMIAALTSDEDDSVAEEAADVLVTIIMILFAREIPIWKFFRAIRKVIEKNAAKTTKTHYVDVNGMISRRPYGQ